MLSLPEFVVNLDYWHIQQSSGYVLVWSRYYVQLDSWTCRNHRLIRVFFMWKLMLNSSKLHLAHQDMDIEAFMPASVTSLIDSHSRLHHWCIKFFTSGVQRICPTSSSSTPSAISGDFVLLPPELPSFDEPGLSSDGGPSLFVVQSFGTLFPQLSAPQTLTLLSGVR